MNTDRDNARMDAADRGMDYDRRETRRRYGDYGAGQFIEVAKDILTLSPDTRRECELMEIQAVRNLTAAETQELSEITERQGNRAEHDELSRTPTP